MIAQLDREYLEMCPAKTMVRLISYAFFEGRPVTTKGRWINRLVFVLFEILKKTPQLSGVDRPIFWWEVEEAERHY